MSTLLKDLYNKAFIDALATGLSGQYRKFDTAGFKKQIFDKAWKDKELKQRMRHISETLRQFLPADYRKTLEMLKPVSSRFDGIECLVFPDFVEAFGLDDFEASILALEHFTRYSSSEFPVRPFIIKYGNRMMKQMMRWAASENEHVRRLASEGCRPRLPWAMALPEFRKNPGQVLKILEKLKSDESEYVRRSVANNLNDISKDNPELVLDIAKRWLGADDNTDRIVKHACRSLLKAGDQRALTLFGFRRTNSVQITDFVVQKKVRMGEVLEFSFVVQHKKSALGKLRIEYGVDFVKANKQRARKIFKISEASYPEQSKQVSRKHSFKKITTRKYYPGVHGLAVIVNGVELGLEEFIVTQ